MSNDHKKSYVILSIMFLIINILIYNSLLTDKFIFYGDLITSLDSHQYVKGIIPLWNESVSSSNITTLSKFFISLPLFALDIIGIYLPMTYVFFIYNVILSTLSALFMFKLTTYIISNAYNNEYTKYFSFLASIIYISSPFVIEEASHMVLKYGYYLMPLVLYLIIKGSHESKHRYSLLAIIIWSFSVGGMHFIIFGSIIIISYLIYDLIYSNIKKTFDYNKFRFLIISFLFIIIGFVSLNSYFILPGIYQGGTSLYGNILTEETIKNVTFRNADIINIFALRGGFNSNILYNDFTLPLIDNAKSLLFGVSITIIGLSILLFIKKIPPISIYLLILICIMIFLSGGPNINNELFNWFIFEAPFSNYYAWAFRTPKALSLLPLLVAPLIAIFGATVSTYIKKCIRFKKITVTFPYIFIGLIITIYLLANYPILSGDFNGIFRSTEIPPEYYEAVSYIEFVESSATNKTYYKGITGPPYAGTITTWHNMSVGSFENYILPFPILMYENINYDLLFANRLRYDPFIFTHNTTSIVDFYKPLNIRYIIIHNDISWLNETTTKLLQILDNQKDLRKIFTNDILSVYKIDNISQEFGIKDNNILIIGGLEKYEALSNIKTFNSNNIGVKYSNKLELESLKYFDFIVSGPYQIMPSIGKEVELFDTINNYDPKNKWSKIPIESSTFKGWLQREGIPLLYTNGLNGTIFTLKSNAMMNINDRIEKSDYYNVYINYLQNEKGGKIAVRIDNETYYLDTKEDVNIFRWIKLSTLYLEEGIHDITIENIDGLNAITKLVFVSKDIYNKTRMQIEDALQNKTIIYNLEAESDFHKPKVHIVKENDKRIKQILESDILDTIKKWDFNTKEQFDEWMDYNKVYEYYKFTNSDDRINAELYNSAWGWKIINSPLINIDSQSSYRISFDINGINAHKVHWKIVEYNYNKEPINTIYVGGIGNGNFSRYVEMDYIPSEKVYYIQLQIWHGHETSQPLPNIVSLDNVVIYDINGYIELINSNLFDNGMALKLDKSHKLWQSLDIIKDGYYRLVLKGNGKFDILLNNITLKINSNEVIYIYTEPFWLQKGFHTLQIKPLTDDAILDSIWVYADNQNRTLEQLFMTKEKYTKINTYIKESPTLWSVKVSSMEPFMLSFAERFDPNWIAIIKKDDVILGYVKPVKLYGVINGFWIDQTGELDIIIMYEPQMWFEKGIIISFSTFVMFSTYIIYEWRRDKNDRWALKITRTINNANNRIKRWCLHRPNKDN